MTKQTFTPRRILVLIVIGPAAWFAAMAGMSAIGVDMSASTEPRTVTERAPDWWDAYSGDVK